MKKLVSILVVVSILISALPMSAMAEKETPAKPVPPIVLSASADTVVVAYINGYEYKMGDGEWQTVNLFTGLEPGTKYVIYQRIAETDTMAASESSDGLSVRTDRATPTRPNPPVVESYDADYLYLVPTDGYEYCVDGGYWQKSNRFNVSYGKEHKFYQRVAETERNYASPASEALVYHPEKFTYPPITEEDIGNIKNRMSDTKSVLNYFRVYFDSVYDSIYQFCLVGDDFSTSWSYRIDFRNLSPSTGYTLYVRRAGTNKYNVGEAVEVCKIITPSIADSVKDDSYEAPYVIDKTDTSVKIENSYDPEVYRMQFALTDTDGNIIRDWSTATVFTDLEPDTEYIIYGRRVYYDEYYNLVITDSLTKPLVVRTLKPGEIYPKDIGQITIASPTGLPDYPIKIYTHRLKGVSLSDLVVSWYRNGEIIPGETDFSYIPTVDDIGCIITAKVVHHSDPAAYAVSNEYEMVKYIKGDVNGDKVINLSDVTMTLMYIAEWELEGFNEKAGNVDKNKIINLSDVIWMMKTIAGWDI